jgi:hypothetical protein
MSIDFQKNLTALHITFLAVYDGLVARIGALRRKDRGCKNVGGGWRGNGAKRNDLAERNPGGP